MPHGVTLSHVWCDRLHGNLIASCKKVQQLLKGWGTKVNLLENNNAAMQFLSACEEGTIHVPGHIDIER
jgi:hypothetical protein